MNPVALALRQIRYTNKAFWRNPLSASFTFVFPLMFLVIFTGLFGNDQTTVAGVRISTSTYYVASIATFSIITATYTNLAISVTIARDGGVLKRIRATPLPASAYLAARIAHAVLMAVILVGIVVAFGAAFYDTEIPTRTLPALLSALAVGAATFAALGLAITAIVPNADAAPPIVNGTILPLLFISGIFIPLQDPNAWYVQLAKVFPVYHFSEAMKAAYFAPSGTGFAADPLLVMAAWGLAGTLLAVRFFSWEPRR